LFSSLLNYRHSAASDELQWPQESGVQFLFGKERTNYPILMSVDDLGEGFATTAQTDHRIDARRMTAYLHAAVDSVVTALDHNHQAAVTSLSILPESERHQILAQFNATGFRYDEERLIHELFEEQVERTPEAIAVEIYGRSLTYGDLNARANQLARYLRTHGVLPDDPVGLCMERSLEMIIGVLGILKAGGAYVPLDPNYPTDRLTCMLEDTAPKVLLTQKRLIETLPKSSATILALDNSWTEIAGFASTNLPRTELNLTADTGAYVIFTSGSTGRPKGTVMAHRSMMNLMQWHRSQFRPAQRTLQFAALSFDVGFQEIFATLTTGGHLVLLDEWVRRDATALVKLLQDRSIERLFVPPLVLQSLAESLNAARRPPMTLQDIITAGEQLRISPEIRSLFTHLSSCRLHNHYGPTETHVVTALTLQGNPADWPTFPAIGYPISNTQIYILDPQRNPVPIGAPGEIYIAGEGVARGYLHRPDLTEQRFIADPFANDPSARMYRTGDLGRWTANGCIDYLGRNDEQVKIRGYRIELGEIEAQLAIHQDVKDAVVITRADTSGEKRLVAYVTERDQRTVTVDSLRAYLKQLLPEYMVPSAFVILETLPVTPSGKLNRRMLPAPGLDAYSTGQHEPPQGPIEQTIARLWQELLHIERVGRQSNFFELGGHSLHGMKLVTKISQCFGVDLPVIALFEHPTVEDLAACVVAGLDDGSPEGAVAEFEEGIL
jgi:amino acid adenylation domain-containing protein